MKEILLILFVGIIVYLGAVHYLHIGDNTAQNWLSQQINFK